MLTCRCVHLEGLPFLVRPSFINLFTVVGLTKHFSRYWKEPYFKALALLRPICESHGFTLPEVALRWLSHHSLMKREYGDAILLGASSLKHAAQNLDDLDKGPLREHHSFLRFQYYFC